MIPVAAFADREVLVFGLARSGLASARALRAGQARVLAWDQSPAAREAAAAEGFDLVDPQGLDFSRLAAVVLSPGVPLTHPAPHPVVVQAREAGVEVIGDIELFARAVAEAPEHKRPTVVAITGTNGKSTTTALIAHVLAEAGRDVRIGGNIGWGVLGLAPMHGGAVYVLELSSYQLDLTSSLHAKVAVLLNISPDHLDRHGGMEGYAAAKRRILLNQTHGDTAVIGVDDVWGERICTEITAANRRTIWPISARKALSRGVYGLEGRLYDAATTDRVSEVADLAGARSLPGRHNTQNAAAAYAAARAVGLSREEAVAGLMSFPGLAHRMETVGSLTGVRFVNDSKATNVDAARQALASYRRIHWIAGGRPKSGIGELADLFGVIAKAYLIGEAAADFAATLEGEVPTMICGELQTAVRAAYADAARDVRAGADEAIVLFSPACASFDQFTDFEARGEAFRAAVQALAVEASREESVS
ncbi:MAG: UDP-N-acetylmuramoyl-L-alanine--D-glutamate ligase [Alphaproteobacteria bacterium]|nr:UDP-N-acetylmuramoyl-L-alanine--D-glutamate ligase [Alphaproteobacteria bacterium]